eukprot:CAMPEP_0181390992 /NCGR_PEP_ID=MMETSP1106-20121128/25798_1 /TAXON_ID=81844 /ORGANISM="Mantoniella antarctica, Strain SL-175" /LENGTH=64 /DNA_ID=CAMNT_0023511975 /DNA_START=287 /DNA_END=479 /DNA_ORIENTATION=-
MATEMTVKAAKRAIGVGLPGALPILGTILLGKPKAGNQTGPFFCIVTLTILLGTVLEKETTKKG